MNAIILVTTLILAFAAYLALSFWALGRKADGVEHLFRDIYHDIFCLRESLMARGNGRALAGRLDDAMDILLEVERMAQDGGEYRIFQGIEKVEEESN